MMRLRLKILVAAATVVVVGTAAYAAIASTGSRSDERSSIVPDSVQAEAVDVVNSASNAPGSPLAVGSETELTLLFAPTDTDLPWFFTVPTADGGACIVTADRTGGTLGSCTSAQELRPGTVTALDDVEGSGIPPFVYGQLDPTVKSVTVHVAGAKYQAAVESQFYVLKLPDPAMIADDIESVVFELNDGTSFTQRVFG